MANATQILKRAVSIGLLLIGILQQPAPSAGAGPANLKSQTSSLCREEEQVLFSCAVVSSVKVISLCGSKNLANRRGYLQYRFGAAGAVELQFPHERANTQLAFRYAHYFRAQVYRTEITFENGDYRYILFEYYEGDLKPAVSSAGVRVRKHGPREPETELQCRDKAVSRLGHLETIIRRDPDNPLNR